MVARKEEVGDEEEDVQEEGKGGEISDLGKRWKSGFRERKAMEEGG